MIYSAKRTCLGWHQMTKGRLFFNEPEQNYSFQILKKLSAIPSTHVIPMIIKSYQKERVLLEGKNHQRKSTKRFDKK